MSKNSITGYVGSAMSAVFFHKFCSDPVEARHGRGGALECLDALLRVDDVTDFVPIFTFLVHPLMSVDGDLSAERFGQDENVADASAVRGYESTKLEKVWDGVQTDSYKIRDQNHWPPPLQLTPINQFGYMR